MKTNPTPLTAVPPQSERDALILAEVERAVAPYLGVAPPAMVEKLRELADRYYRTHPEALRILDVVSAHHGDPLRSGTVALGDANAEPVTTPKAKRM